MFFQSYTQCSCGNAYGKHGLGKESECNRLCRGDNSEVCGGRWRNSVYAVGAYVMLSVTDLILTMHKSLSALPFN